MLFSRWFRFGAGAGAALALWFLAPVLAHATSSSRLAVPDSHDYPSSGTSGDSLGIVTLHLVMPKLLRPAPGSRYVGIIGVDTNGAPLDGNRSYVLHLEKSQLPPPDVRWSLTVYGDDPLREDDGASIDDRSALRFNPDGSLDLYLQPDAPRPGAEANWLATPARPFNLAASLYRAGAASQDGSWRMPAPARID